MAGLAFGGGTAPTAPICHRPRAEIVAMTVQIDAIVRYLTPASMKESDDSFLENVTGLSVLVKMLGSESVFGIGFVARECLFRSSDSRRT